MFVKYAQDGSIEASSGFPFPDAQQVSFEVVRGYDGKLYEKGKEPVKTPEEVQAEAQAALQAEFTSAIQERLDSFAQTRGYDNIMSACSYFGSGNPRFKAEADRAIALRDATWAKCYEILDDVQSGKRPIPTPEELFAELPALEWEDTDVVDALLAGQYSQ